MQRDHLVEKALARVLSSGIGYDYYDRCVADAYRFYMSVGGQMGYYDFRKQAQMDLKRLLSAIRREGSG